MFLAESYTTSSTHILNDLVFSVKISLYHVTAWFLKITLKVGTLIQLGTLRANRADELLSDFA